MASFEDQPQSGMVQEKRPDSSWEVETHRLESSLASLKGLLGALEGRLTPVTGPVLDEATSSGETPHPVMSPVVHAVWSAANIVESANKDLHRIIDRLEV